VRNGTRDIFLFVALLEGRRRMKEGGDNRTADTKGLGGAKEKSGG
jgi:hypothetical protein